MAQAQASGFELRLWPEFRAGCITVFRGVGQAFLAPQHLQHLLGIVFPVGCQVDIGTRHHAAGQQLDERRLDQPSFVMALFRPGVRKINVHACQGVRRDHVVQHFHRVVLDDAHVRQARLVDAFEHGADPGIEDFHAQEVVLRACLRDFFRRFAHAEADLQDGRRLPPEDLAEIKQAFLEGDGPQRQQAIEGLALARRDVRAPMDEAADVRGTGWRAGGAHGIWRKGNGLVLHDHDCSGWRLRYNFFPLRV